MARPPQRERTGRGTADLRPDIQGLRAVAVLAVVIYHIWPTAAPGGFVGVDVFFVISGFLITAHLLREVERSGRVQLGAFWARRIRRLLPAALLVLAVSLWLTLALLPQTVWQGTLKQIGAAAVYAVNWVLAADAIDYLAAENEASVVQHYWSLSVEEQFYILWPLLITLSLGGLALARRLHRLRRVHRQTWVEAQPSRRTERRVLAAVLVLVFAGSLALSIWQTAAEPGLAYFSTAVRAWEFAAGGLLAFVPVWAGASVPSEAARTAAAWLGLAAIVVAALCFSGATPFPSYTALLPVVGAAMVIAAGTQSQWWSATGLLRLWPMQRIGDWSYSIYLWHWPLVVLYPYLFGDAPSLLGGLALLAASLLLAAVTKWLVEDPVRHATWLSRRRSPAYALAVVGAVLLGLLPWQYSAQMQEQAERRQAALLADAEQWAMAQGRIDTAIDSAKEQLAEAAALEAVRFGCSGANAMITPADYCEQQRSTDTLRPRVAALADDVGQGFICYTQQPGVLFRGCTYGPAKAKTRVAVIGDSHAAMLFSALQPQLQRLNWKVTVYLGRCVWANYAAKDPCFASLADARKDLRSGRYDLILATGQYGKPVVSGEAGIQRLQQAWAPAIKAGSTVIAITDNPEISDRTYRCLTQSGDSIAKARKCTAKRATALPAQDPYLQAAATLDGALGIDLTDLYCGPETCAAAIGGVAVYRDTHHITTSYWRTLLPHLLRRVEAAMAAQDEATKVDTASVR